MLLLSVTSAPPEGAGPSRVTVAVEDEPPTKLVGFRETVVRLAGLTVSPAVAVPELQVAEIVATVVVRTGLLVTLKVAEAEPAGTVTLPETVATEVLLLARVTSVPPAGDGPVRVTVAVDDAPPITAVGFSTRDDGVTGTGVTVRVAVRTVLLKEADSVAEVLAVTTLVETGNVAEVAFTATATFWGTWAVRLSLESATTMPPIGAATLRVTVPVAGLPPMTVAGFTETAAMVTGSTVSVANRLFPRYMATILAEILVGTRLVVIGKVAVC